MSPLNEPGKRHLLFTGQFMKLRNDINALRDFTKQTTVFRNANDIVHSVPVHPVKHSVTAETTVRAHGDLCVRPVPANKFYQQRQYRPAVFGAINVAGPEITDQWMTTAENIQGAESSSGHSNHERTGPPVSHGPEYPSHQSRG